MFMDKKYATILFVTPLKVKTVYISSKRLMNSL